MEDSTPATSKPTWKPSSPKSSAAASFKEPFVTLSVWAMPHSRALLRRRSLTSVMSTFFAPRARQNCATRLPIVPAPLTTTFLPFTSVRAEACAPTAEGSIMAPKSSDISSGNLNTRSSSTTKRSCAAPSAWKACTRRCSQTLYCPRLQGLQVPHTSCGRAVTLSPTWHLVTSAPQATTVPAYSCPCTTG